MNKTKVITGVCIAVFYFGMAMLAALVHPFFFEFMAAIFMLIAAHEVAKAMEDKPDKPSKFQAPNHILILVACIGGYALYNIVVYLLPRFGFSMANGGIFALLCWVLLMMVIQLFLLLTSKKTLPEEKTANFLSAMSTYFVLVYPVGILTFLMALTQLNNYVTAIYLLLTTTSLSDTLANFIGCWLKGKKLAPNISPNKTISGSMGGLLGGIIGSVAVFIVADFNLLNAALIFENTALNIVFVFVLGIAMSIFTQAGDLIASYLKRMLEIKDFGTILPGHGGIMDRIDGMMVASVFLFFFFTIVGLL